MNAALAHKMIAAMAGRGAPLPPPMPGPLHAPSRRRLPLSSPSADLYSWLAMASRVLWLNQSTLNTQHSTLNSEWLCALQPVMT